MFHLSYTKPTWKPHWVSSTVVIIWSPKVNWKWVASRSLRSKRKIYKKQRPWPFKSTYDSKFLFINIPKWLYSYISKSISLNVDFEKFQKKSQLKTLTMRYVCQPWSVYQPCFTLHNQIRCEKLYICSLNEKYSIWTDNASSKSQRLSNKNPKSRHENRSFELLGLSKWLLKHSLFL